MRESEIESENETGCVREIKREREMLFCAPKVTIEAKVHVCSTAMDKEFRQCAHKEHRRENKTASTTSRSPTETGSASPKAVALASVSAMRCKSLLSTHSLPLPLITTISCGAREGVGSCG